MEFCFSHCRVLYPLFAILMIAYLNVFRKHYNEFKQIIRLSNGSLTDLVSITFYFLSYSEFGTKQHASFSKCYFFCIKQSQKHIMIINLYMFFLR